VGVLNDAHTLVPVVEPSTASQTDSCSAAKQSKAVPIRSCRRHGGARWRNCDGWREIDRLELCAHTERPPRVGLSEIRSSVSIIANFGLCNLIASLCALMPIQSDLRRQSLGVDAFTQSVSFRQKVRPKLFVSFSDHKINEIDRTSVQKPI